MIYTQEMLNDLSARITAVFDELLPAEEVRERANGIVNVCAMEREIDGDFALPVSSVAHKMLGAKLGCLVHLVVCEIERVWNEYDAQIERVRDVPPLYLRERKFASMIWSR